ncbi:MAG: hypothetical protein K0U98_25475 [Deltaproteobacteria bacterium]|nr:hypothetical protein [Deltaproteobacteria bacterium]
MSHRSQSDEGVRKMANLARSTVRLPWTLGLWGVQLTTHLLDPRRPTRETAASLDALSEIAKQPLEGPLENLRRAGDHLQSGLIDSAADLVSGLGAGKGREPRKAIEEAWGVLGRSWDLFVGGRGDKR